MYQLIALDMDGTLLDSNKQISERNCRAISAAAQRGKIVVLNTGRCLAELEEYFDLLPDVRYLNCASGAQIYDLQERRVLYSHFLDADIVKELLRLAAIEDAMPHILHDKSIVQRDQCKQMGKYGMGIYQAMFERVAEQWENIIKDYQASPFPAAKINIYHISPASRSRTEKRIIEAGLNVTFAESERTSLEMSAAGVNKGTGLEKLCMALALPMDQTIVVGDADNDLDSLKKAGLAVAMGNANQSVKEVAAAVVADCDHDGCAEAIEKYLLT